MSKITIMRGLPASGKSGLAKEMVATEPNLVRVNRDAIRWTQGTFPFGTPEQEEMVSVIEEALVVGAIKAGKDVVIDACHLNPYGIRKWFKIAKTHGVRDVAIVSLEVPIAELLERDANRQKSVGQGVIAKMAKRYKIEDDGKLGKAPQWNAPPIHQLTLAAPWNPEKTDAIIVDVDNTLAMLNGRGPYDTSLYHTDRLEESVAKIVNTLSETYPVLITSGRRETFREQTVDWLRRNNVHFDHVFMRGAEDDRNDSIVKHDLYHQYIKPRWNVVMAFDDRDRVVKTWREMGIKTAQVEYGDF